MHRKLNQQNQEEQDNQANSRTNGDTRFSFRPIGIIYAQASSQLH